MLNTTNPFYDFIVSRFRTHHAAQFELYTQADANCYDQLTYACLVFYKNYAFLESEQFDRYFTFKVIEEATELREALKSKDFLSSLLELTQFCDCLILLSKDEERNIILATILASIIQDFITLRMSGKKKYFVKSMSEKLFPYATRDCIDRVRVKAISKGVLTPERILFFDQIINSLTQFKKL